MDLLEDVNQALVPDEMKHLLNAAVSKEKTRKSKSRKGKSSKRNKTIF
jgi:hypothetical protein